MPNARKHTDSMFLGNVGIYLHTYTALQPTRPTTTISSLTLKPKSHVVVTIFFLNTEFPSHCSVFSLIQSTVSPLFNNFIKFISHKDNFWICTSDTVYYRGQIQIEDIYATEIT